MWNPIPTPSFLRAPKYLKPGIYLHGFVKLQRSDGECFKVDILAPDTEPVDSNHYAVIAAVKECVTYINCRCTLTDECEEHKGKNGLI